MDGVVVFIDYQNVHGWASRVFQPAVVDPAAGHIDPLRTAKHLVRMRRRGGELRDVRVYRGRPNPERQSGATRANDRQASAWQASSLVTVVRRNLQYPRD